MDSGTQAEMVAQANALFESLTPAQRRVEIAKEALARITPTVGDATWNPETGDYIDFDGNLNRGAPEDHLMCQLIKDRPNCTLCARGALFLAAVVKFDRFQFKHTPESWDDGVAITVGQMASIEKSFFTPEQIGLVETAFECDRFGWHDLGWDTEGAAVRFGSRYEDARGRLQAILKNIIDNNGTFMIPNDCFEPVTADTVE